MEIESTEISPIVMATLTKFLNEKFDSKNYVLNIELACQKGDNYMGIVYRITASTPDSLDGDIHLIVKVPPKNPLRRQQFFARPGFLREIQAYEEFLPLIYDFQKSKGLQSNEIFSEYPLCHFTLSDEFHEAICMNDLQDDGFYMHDRFKPLLYEHVAFIMVIYGKLHAISLVLKNENPAKILNLKKMVDIFVQRKDDPQLNEYFESLKKSALESLDKEKDKGYWCKLNSYFKQGTFYDLMLKLLDGESSEPYTVICHGDCWVNNVMFKYEQEKIIDARLIDWQIMRYASPIIDLMYFLMSCTTKEFRREYFTDMLNIYHTAAKEHIQKLGSNSEQLYPRDALDREFKNKGAIGLLFGMIVLPILTTKSEDVPDLEKLSEKVSSGHSTDAMEAGFVGAKSDVFNERMRGIIFDTIDWGLL